MRPLLVLVLLVGCSMPPVPPAADGGIVGDSSVLVDSGVDARPPQADAGIGGDTAVADAGVDAGGELDAGPVHLDQWEVWGSDLAAFRAAGSPEATVDIPGIGLVASGPTTPQSVTGPCTTTAGQIPANCITWGEAFALCAFLGRRMPTAEEWLEESGDPGPWDITSGGTPRASIRADHPCDQSIARVCDARGNVSEWVVDGGNTAMGESYDSSSISRTQNYASADVGVRCWGAAR